MYHSFLDGSKKLIISKSEDHYEIVNWLMMIWNKSANSVEDQNS